MLLTIGFHEDRLHKPEVIMLENSEQQDASLPVTTALRKNILLVEDYAPNALVVAAMLDLFSYDCDVATNGIDALRLFPTGTYDLILMDIDMPVMDGLSATRQIRNLEESRGNAPIPIIAMSAKVDLSTRMSCAQAGMNGFIPKPFSQTLLSELLSDFMSPNPATDKEYSLSD